MDDHIKRLEMSKELLIVYRFNKEVLVKKLTYHATSNDVSKVNHRNNDK